MSFSFLKFFAIKKRSNFNLKNSEVYKAFHSLAKHSNLLIFHDARIYHHRKKSIIPLLIFDNFRGLYIIEQKAWSFKMLYNSNIERKKNLQQQENNLAFSSIQELLKEKYNDTAHKDLPPLFNFLIMNNLTVNEYEKLSASLKTLLPQSNIIFSDNSRSEIFKKIQDVSYENPHLDSCNEILSNLLIEYTIVNKENEVYFCTQEQRNFIDSKLQQVNNLHGPNKSGKTALLILKALQELLRDDTKNLIVLTRTEEEKNVFTQRLLNTVKHAMVEVPIQNINIMSSEEYMNLSAPIHADIFMCDDANLLKDEVRDTINALQKRSKLLFVNAKKEKNIFTLKKYFTNKERKVLFHHGKQQAKALYLVQKILQNNEVQDIIVIGKQESLQMLQYDLKHFIPEDVIVFNKSIPCSSQDGRRLFLCNYANIKESFVKHAILLDIKSANIHELDYALQIASQDVHIIYEEESDNINILRQRYENSKK